MLVNGVLDLEYQTDRAAGRTLLYTALMCGSSASVAHFKLLVTCLGFINAIPSLAMTVAEPLFCLLSGYAIALFRMT